MKRIFIAAAAIVAFSATSFASNNYSVLEKLNDKTVQKGMSRYLKTTSEQEEQLKLVFSESTKKMKKDADYAMQFNLGNVKAVLTPEQYKKYLLILNTSVANDMRTEMLAEK